jgi:hypothetical protein
VQYTTANVTAVTVPVILDEKQKYLIVHAILMALKEMVGEEELVKRYRKQGELKFTFRTEQLKSSLLTAM